MTRAEWYEAVRKELATNYDLSAEDIEDATIDIVDRCFCCGIPTLAELPEYIADYMNR